MSVFVVTHPELGVARPVIVRAQNADEACQVARDFHSGRLPDAIWPPAEDFTAQALRLPAGGVLELFADGVIEPAQGPDTIDPQGQIWLVPATTGDPIVPDLLVVAENADEALALAQQRAEHKDLEIELTGEAHVLLPAAQMSSGPALSELPSTF